MVSPKFPADDMRFKNHLKEIEVRLSFISQLPNSHIEKYLSKNFLKSKNRASKSPTKENKADMTLESD